jgi:hypothetical protein
VISGVSDRITISSVAISGSSVVITCASDLPATGAKVAYAYNGGTKRTNGTYRWGLLRDSDTFKGYTTGVAQPNYCVSFVLPLQATTTTPAPTPAGQLIGDANGDGAVNIVDALVVAQCYVGLISCTCNSVIDVNNDSSCNIVDALRIAQYYVGLIPGF